MMPYNLKIDFKTLDFTYLKNILSSHGIAFDKYEMDYYREYFSKTPNLIELYDLCQSNSEHSRHWFFRGKYNLKKDLTEQNNLSLFKMVKSSFLIFRIKIVL